MAHVTKHPTFPQYRMKVGVMPDFSGANAVMQEEPLGVKDGVNTIFMLAKDPIKNSEMVFKDGMYMRKGVDYDYTINGREIRFKEAPEPNATIIVNYKAMEVIP
jgi:hypothetical protein